MEIHTTETFHYPPELFELLIQTIPLLCKGKKDVILFFRGAGVTDSLYVDLANKIEVDKNSISKYEITRTLLTRLNEHTDLYLSQRRELLKRISEFETFTNCWPKDQFSAKGYVAEVRKVIQTKDAFTRMEQEREKELAKHRAAQLKKANEIKIYREKLDNIKNQFYSLFQIKNAQERGKKLETVLNSLFEVNGILIRDAFTLTGDTNEGIIEQIDGVVEIDNQIYLVEMKWLNKPVSNQDVHQHLGRVFSRPRPNGIFISASGFTDSAIIAAKEGIIRNAIFILMDFEEFINILENELNIVLYVRDKILKALIEKDPYHKPIMEKNI